jgi:hypothetical protein
MAKFIIKDWAGNHLFQDKVFDTFVDGWEFIEQNVDNSLYEATGNDNDDNWQEYFVVKL